MQQLCPDPDVQAADSDLASGTIVHQSGSRSLGPLSVSADDLLYSNCRQKDGIRQVGPGGQRPGPSLIP